MTGLPPELIGAGAGYLLCLVVLLAYLWGRPR